MNRNLALLLLLLAVLVMARTGAVCRAAMTASWVPLQKANTGYACLPATVTASVSGRYLAIRDENGHARILQSKDGVLSADPVYDSLKSNRIIWAVGWNGDNPVFAATDGVASVKDALKSVKMDPEDDELSYLAPWAEKAKTIVRDLGTGTEIRLRDGGFSVAIGDKASSVIALAGVWTSPKSAGPGVVSFIDAKTGKEVRAVDPWEHISRPNPLCWSQNPKGLVVCGDQRTGDRAVTSVEDFADYLRSRKMLALIAADGSVKPLEQAISASKPGSPPGVTCVPGDFCAVFKPQGKGDAGIAVRVVSLAGKPSRDIKVRNANLPAGGVEPVAVLPDLSGILVSCTGKTRQAGLYFHEFATSRNTQVLSDVTVEHVYTSLGTQGVVLGVRQASAKPGAVETIGVVFVKQAKT